MRLAGATSLVLAGALWGVGGSARIIYAGVNSGMLCIRTRADVGEQVAD